MATRLPQQLVLRFISKPNCQLCTEAKEELMSLASKKGVPISLQEVNILEPQNKAFHDEFVFEIPVVQIVHTGQELFRHRVNESKVSQFLERYAKELSL